MNIDRFSPEWLLQPTDVSAFFRDTWEKRPLTLFRGDAAYFRELLSLEDMDHILSSHDLRYPSLQLVKNKAPVPPPQYTTEVDVKGVPVGGVVDLTKMFAAYHQGATITLDQLHRRWPPLARLCAGMERFLGHPTQTNVYLTPPGAQGFNAHYDTHDVFILQTAGAKRWRLYGAPVALPLPNNPYPFPGPDPGKPTDDFVLRAGDVLYLPRGYVHDALTSDSVSLHVTLGINTYTYADLFMEALGALFQRDVRFRQSLPIGFAFDREAAAKLREACGPLVRELAEGKLPVQEIADGLAERFIMSRPPLFDGHLTGLLGVRQVTPQSRVCKRAWLCRLTMHGDTVELQYHGKGMTFPRSLEPTFRFILENDAFTVASLPGPLKEGDKVRLVQQLIEEGLLMAEDKRGG
jgi:ribosomal protein L16 Arg81 hydroxylase